MKHQKRNLSSSLFFIVILLACCLLTACASKEPADTPEVSAAVIPTVEVPAEPETVNSEPAEAISDDTETLPLSDKKILVAIYPGVDASYLIAVKNAIMKEYLIDVFLTVIAYPEPDMDMRDDPGFSVQYSAMELIDDVRWAFELPEEYIGSLAITTKDLYSGDPGNDFVYAKTSGNVAVMSTARFTAEGSSKEVILECIVNQALKTTGILNEKYSK